MKRLDERENGRPLLEAGRQGRATVAPAFSHSNWDRLVSEPYFTRWTSLHIAMTSVIVFKRGCIFMCNSFFCFVFFVEIMFANDGASDWFDHLTYAFAFDFKLTVKLLGALAYSQVILIWQTLPSLNALFFTGRFLNVDSVTWGMGGDAKVLISWSCCQWSESIIMCCVIERNNFIMMYFHWLVAEMRPVKGFLLCH